MRKTVTYLFSPERIHLKAIIQPNIMIIINHKEPFQTDTTFAIPGTWLYYVCVEWGSCGFEKLQNPILRES